MKNWQLWLIKFHLFFYSGLDDHFILVCFWVVWVTKMRQCSLSNNLNTEIRLKTYNRIKKCRITEKRPIPMNFVRSISPLSWMLKVAGNRRATQVGSPMSSHVMGTMLITLSIWRTFLKSSTIWIAPSAIRCWPSVARTNLRRIP